jgi:hypothetical protein
VYSAAPTTANTPSNPFGSLMQLIFDNVYQDTAPTNRHNLKTGANIASDLLAEVDRKIDDGLANAGQFRYSSFGAASAYATCTNATNGWQSTTPVANCGAVSLF